MSDIVPLLRSAVNIDSASGSLHRKRRGSLEIRGGEFKIDSLSEGKAAVIGDLIDRSFKLNGVAPISTSRTASGNIKINVSPELIQAIFETIDQVDDLMAENLDLKDKNTSLENYAQDAKKARDEMEHQLEQEKRRTAKLEQQIRESDPNYIPQPEDFIFTDVTYEKFWTDINTNLGYNGICRFLSLQSYSEQEEILQRLNRFQIPEDKKAPFTYFRWEEAKKEGKATITLREKLNGPLDGNHSIQELYKLVKGPKNAKKVIDYCLRCYRSGIQLKP